MARLLLLIVLFAIVTLAICSSVPHDNISKLSHANDDFAIRLLQTLERVQLDKSLKDRTNVFISPFSIGSVLSMLLAGAVNQTYTQIYQTLGFDNSTLANVDLFSGYQKIVDDLNSNSQSTQNGSLSVANSIAIQKNYALIEDFMNNITTYFESQVFAEDFTKSAVAATKEINDWVSEKTQGKIAKLFEQDLSASTVMLLVNAIYFKGNWKAQFSKSKTLPAFFFNPDDQKEAKPTVMTMNLKGKFNYAEFSDGQLIEIPYENDSLSMFVFLPPYGQNKSISSLFTATKLEQRLDQLTFQTVNLYFPKFKLQETYQLVSTLQSMGILDAFGASADFSGINGNQDLHITQVVHKTFIEVNEQGSEAAAATGIALGGDGSIEVIPLQEIDFRADHPFMFLIRDRKNHVTLFAGIVNNPSKS